MPVVIIGFADAATVEMPDAAGIIELLYEGNFVRLIS